MYQRIHKPSPWKSKPQETSSQFELLPLIQPKQHINNNPTQKEIENPVYNHQEHKTAELESGESKGNVIPEVQEKIEYSPRIDGAVFSRQVIRPPMRGIQMKRNIGQSVDEKVSIPEAKTEPPKKQETESTKEPNQKTIPQSENPSQLKKSSTTGLAKESLTNSFAQEVDDFWKNPANQDKPVTELINFMMAKINEKLPYKCRFSSKSSHTDGVFDSERWYISINTENLKTDGDLPTIGEMNTSEVGELISTLYHEARHSEQFFRMAQMRAGQGKNAQQIQKEMRILLPVAEAAVKSPLKDNIEANKEMLAEAEEWNEFQYGKYGDYNDEITTMAMLIADIQKVYDEHSIGRNNQTMAAFLKINDSVQNQLQDFFEPLKIQIEKQAQKNQYDQEVLDNIREISSDSNAIKERTSQPKDYQNKQNENEYNQTLTLIDNLAKTIHKIYKSNPLERDAFNVGNAAQSEFQNRNPIFKRRKKH